MEFPKRPDQHVFESESFTILRDELPSRWVIREISERDYGIDLYVEIVGETGDMRGDMVALQLKSKKKIMFDGGCAALKGVKRTTLNYWVSLPVPVFVCVVCLTKRKCYWGNIKDLYRKGHFRGASKKVSIPLLEKLDVGSAFGTSLFIASYVREKKWPAIEAAIEKSLMLFNTLGPLVLMCLRSEDDKPCSTTLQYLINDHYENYTLMSQYLLGEKPKYLPYWYDRNLAYLKTQRLPPSFTFYFKVMKEMLRAMVRGYRESVLRAYEMVMETQNAYFSTRYVYLCMHLQNRPHTFLADDWYARYYFDEYENETQHPEELYFKDFDVYDNMLDDLIRS